MELKVTMQRFGESHEEWKIRNAWALRASVKAGDLAAGSRLRGFKPSTPVDLNNDRDVTLWSGWGHKSQANDQASTNPWQRGRSEMKDPKLHPEPWKLGIRPPPVKPISIPSPAASGLANRWQPLVQEQVMIPPDLRSVPIFAIPTPPSVSLVDLVAQQADWDPYEWGDLSLARTLQSIGSQGVVQQRNLPMESRAIGTLLTKGAQLVVRSGKWVVEKANKVLGYVGDAGSIWDAYTFLSWTNDHRADFGPGVVLPKTRYEFGSNQYLFEWPDGSITNAPRNWGIY